MRRAAALPVILAAALALVDTRSAHLVGVGKIFKIATLGFQKTEQRRNILKMLGNQMRHAFRSL